MQQGIGYQECRKLLIKSGIPSGKIETDEYAEFYIYFARAHLIDHETGNICRGPLKIGRGKYKTALMRGRNQPGIDFRVYAEITVPDNYWSRQAENIVEKLLREYHIKGDQGQVELYSLPDSMLRNRIEYVVDRFTTMKFPVNEVRYYGNF
jgi:hypothetical protein